MINEIVRGYRLGDRASPLGEQEHGIFAASHSRSIMQW